MGMRVVADRTAAGPPYPVSVTVTCDGDHGLFDPPAATFDCTDCAPRDPAVRSGWKFRPDGAVHCPEHAK